MGFDPEFSGDLAIKEAPGRRGWRLGRRMALLLLAFSGCHLLMTGSPVPLWHVEHLRNPTSVKAVGESFLVLKDGREVPLPFIRKIPKANPAFLRALKLGVEIGEGGEVIGLIDTPRMCGHNPVWWYRRRANLSDLAGVLNPDGIDDSIVEPETIRFLKEKESRVSRRNGLPFYVMGELAKMRRVYEAYSDKRVKEAALNHSDGSD